jgi:hypothetical protein
MIGGEGFNILPSDFHQSPLGIEDIEKLKFSLAITFTGGIKGKLGTG